MTLKDVPEFVQTTKPIQDKLDNIVQECVQLRKKSKESVVELSKWLEMDRRKISSFENGKFNIYIAENILGWYGKTLMLNVSSY